MRYLRSLPSQSVTTEINTTMDSVMTSAIYSSNKSFAEENGLPMYYLPDQKVPYVDFLSYNRLVHDLHIHSSNIYYHVKKFLYKGKELNLQEARSTLLEYFMPAVSGDGGGLSACSALNAASV